MDMDTVTAGSLTASVREVAPRRWNGTVVVNGDDPKGHFELWFLVTMRASEDAWLRIESWLEVMTNTASREDDHHFFDLLDKVRLHRRVYEADPNEPTSMEDLDELFRDARPETMEPERFKRILDRAKEKIERGLRDSGRYGKKGDPLSTTIKPVEISKESWEKFARDCRRTSAADLMQSCEPIEEEVGTVRIPKLRVDHPDAVYREQGLMGDEHAKWLCSKASRTPFKPIPVDVAHERLVAFLDECKDLMTQKGKDYNPTLYFKEVCETADEVGISPVHVLWVLARKHIGAIIRYMKDGQVASEPIRERLKDLANYAALIAVMLETPDLCNEKEEPK